MFSKYLREFLFRIEFLLIFRRVHYGLFIDESVSMSFVLLFHLLYITFILESEVIRKVFQLNILFEIIFPFFICFLFQEGLFFVTIWW